MDLVRKQLLQLGILALMLLQALGLGHVHAAVLGLPVVKRRLRNPWLRPALARPLPAGIGPGLRASGS